MFVPSHIGANFNLVIRLANVTYAQTRYLEKFLAYTKTPEKHRCSTESAKVKLRPRVLPFDPISGLKLAARERNVMRAGALFLEARRRPGEGRERRKGRYTGEELMPPRWDASSFNAPFARRPTLHVAYLRKSDGHTRGAGGDATRVSRERAGKKVRESHGRRRVGFLRDGGRRWACSRFHARVHVSVAKRPRGKWLLSFATIAYADFPLCKL